MKRNLAAARLGSIRSEAKALSSRRNGMLGGRPKAIQLLDLLKRIEALEEKVTQPTHEMTPTRSKGSVESFWEKDGSFFIIAEHLIKIALFPNHEATRQWKTSVESSLINILRATSNTSLRVKGSAKAYVNYLFKSASDLSDRINQEVPDAHLEVLGAMEPDIELMRTDIDNYNTIEDLGFRVTQYKDSTYGMNYHISYLGHTIADTMNRKQK